MLERSLGPDSSVKRLVWLPAASVLRQPNAGAGYLFGSGKERGRGRQGCVACPVSRPVAYKAAA